ncbi:MAG: hypothetical protein ACXW6K_02520 [Candidatus Binatia bacterium]
MDAPLDMAILDPYLALSNSIMLAKHALHPHAAALLIDLSLSEEGQSMVSSFGRVVLRKGVKPRFPALMKKELFVAVGEFLAPLLEESARDFRQIFLAGR